jgi:DNA-directed RNA polymerase subunit RPC12/RpoP
MGDYSTMMNCPDCGSRVTDPDREGCPTCKPEQYGDVTENYADADKPTCQYCGGFVNRIVPEGAPYWNCDEHGKLNVSEVLGVEPGELRDVSDTGGDDAPR